MSSGETEVKAKRAKMDKGVRVGSWGQLQGTMSFLLETLCGWLIRNKIEWKVDQDSPTDVHRHLSHLVGLYPGYAIAEYDPTLQGGRYTRQQIRDAAAVSLVHRGKGTGADGDAGWEKMWRAAAWAQLGDAKEFYHVLTVSCLPLRFPSFLAMVD